MLLKHSSCFPGTYMIQTSSSSSGAYWLKHAHDIPTRLIKIVTHTPHHFLVVNLLTVIKRLSLAGPEKSLMDFVVLPMHCSQWMKSFESLRRLRDLSSQCKIGLMIFYWLCLRRKMLLESSLALQKEKDIVLTSWNPTSFSEQHSTSIL